MSGQPGLHLFVSNVRRNLGMKIFDKWYLCMVDLPVPVYGLLGKEGLKVPK